MVAWGALSAHKARRGYAFTVENSIYVHHEWQRKGLGRLLMVDLIQRARELGHRTILAGVTSEHTASIRLHESLGFEKVAHFKEVGFKFGEWLDVIYLQLML